MKKHKGIIAGVGLGIAASIAGLVAYGNTVYEAKIKRRATPPESALSAADTLAEPKSGIPEGAQYSEDYLMSFDGLKLYAQIYKQPEYSDKWAIVVHGYTSKGDDLMYATREFFARGYNVLACDDRGHGASEGEYIGMGWHDRIDIISWINYVISRDSNSQVLLYGLSMGAATVMMVSGELLPDNVKCIVEDCGYTSAYEQFRSELKNAYNLPAFPFLQIGNLVIRLRAGYWSHEASALKQVARSVTPIMFIHGDADELVPFAMLDELYNAATCDKEKFIAGGAKHAKANEVPGYWPAVFDFTGKYIR